MKKILAILLAGLMLLSLASCGGSPNKKAIVGTWKLVDTDTETEYGFGMSEEDMLSSGGWGGTNDTYYISVSYYDGTVTVDHLTELPDYNF